MKRGRPAETEQKKIVRERVKNLFKKSSPEAIKILIEIMENNFNNSSVRLKACTYILDKVTPQSYAEEENKPAQQDITINLLPVGNDKKISFEEIEQEIKEVENNSAGNTIVNNNKWDIDANNEDWESDVYNP